MYTDGRAVQCPNEKCRNDSAYWYQLQIRSADEPMTAFYKVGFVSDPRQLSLTNGSVPSVRKNGENELVFSASHTRSLGAFECMAIYPVFFLRPGSTVPFPNARLHFAFYFVLNAGRLRTEFMVHRVALCPSHHSTDRLLPRSKSTMRRRQKVCRMTREVYYRIDVVKCFRFGSMTALPSDVEVPTSNRHFRITSKTARPRIRHLEMEFKILDHNVDRFVYVTAQLGGGSLGVLIGLEQSSLIRTA
jgi:hypothetical protein